MLAYMKFHGTSILGIKVWSTTYNSVVKTVAGWVGGNKKNYICVAAVHLLMECQNDDNLLQTVNSAGLTVSDGMPLVWILKRQGFLGSERIYGPDLLLKICRAAALNKWKIMLVGGAKNQAREVANKLRGFFPKIIITGAIDTPVRPIPRLTDQKIIQHIKKFNPDIVFVGLGCPLQEKWMGKTIKIANRGVFVGVGAAFDFLIGRFKQSPKWMQINGLEWLFRLALDPYRLWKRYTVINMLFLYKLFMLKIKNDS